MDQIITTNPNVLGGTPVFAGTRVPVESLFDYLKHGRSMEFFLEQFPSVRRDHVETLLDRARATVVNAAVVA